MKSLLFVPGDSDRKIDRSIATGADALILDLEDAVALNAKADARTLTAERLPVLRQGRGAPQLLVRINALDSGLADDDLDAVIPAQPCGIMLPKACGMQEIAQLSAMISQREVTAGISPGATRIIALSAETPASVLALASMGPSDRLTAITWGGEDLAAAVGAEANRGPDNMYTDVFRLARSLTLLAAGAAQVDAIDAVYTAYADLDGLRTECEQARRDGFTGKMAIHPAQIPIINAAFSPPAEAIAKAEQIVAAFGAMPDVSLVTIDGKMFDRPHLNQAMRLLQRAGDRTKAK